MPKDDNIKPIRKDLPTRKYSLGPLARATALSMVGAPQQGWPQFPTKFIAVTDVKGERIAYQVTPDNSVRLVSNSVIESDILRYWHNIIPDKAGWQFDKARSARDLAEARKWWLLAADPVDISTIRTIAFKSTPGLASKRLAFDPIVPDGFDFAKTCPITFEFLSRTTNADALLKWVGALFDPNGPSHQYLWLYGAGADGKSAFTRRLSKLFGHAFGSEQPPNRGDRFWTSGLIGKALVAFPDVSDPGFFTSGLFKSLTGGDSSRVEFKASSIIDVIIPARYMITTNDIHCIRMSWADLRRLIYCSVARPTELYEGDYEGDWDAEMPAFISYAHKVYQEWRADSAGALGIPSEMEEAKAIAGSNDEEYEALYRKYTTTENMTGKAPLSSGELVEILKREYPNDPKQRNEMRKYISYVKGHGPATVQRHNELRQRYYHGVYLLPGNNITG